MMSKRWFHSGASSWWRTDGLAYARRQCPAVLEVFAPHRSTQLIEVNDPFDDQACQALIDALWSSDVGVSLQPPDQLRIALGSIRPDLDTAPNPRVGARLLRDRTLIGYGTTEPPPGRHAEVVAIDMARRFQDIQDATLYTTLEPCSHHGATPPCVDTILSEPGIRRVVIGCRDPNPLIDGAGIKALRVAGLQVVVGVEAVRCRRQIVEWAEAQGFSSSSTDTAD